MSEGQRPCDVCQGACCEVFSVNFNGLNEDTVKWLGYHGQAQGAVIAFNCRCDKLTNRGKCAIYSERPKVCQDFPVGSPACLNVVRERRSPNQAARIYKLIARMGKEQ